MTVIVNVMVIFVGDLRLFQYQDYMASNCKMNDERMWKKAVVT
jgi:hypothetical protein